MLGSILTWIVLGLIAGALAKLIYPGRQGGGIFATIGLGILGAIVGGWVAQALFGITAAGLSWQGILFAVIGAMILIFIWGLLTQRAV
jgi:uncharacterized membrane protein YeaQ/YmgE (transglycosylase-associated protein family)